MILFTLLARSHALYVLILHSPIKHWILSLTTFINCWSQYTIVYRYIHVHYRYVVKIVNKDYTVLMQKHLSGNALQLLATCLLSTLFSVKIQSNQKYNIDSYYALTNETILLFFVSVIVIMGCIGCIHSIILFHVKYSMWWDATSCHM